jgi:hypothetical protein
MCFCGEGGIGVIGYDLLAESGAFKIFCRAGRGLMLRCSPSLVRMSVISSSRVQVPFIPIVI